MKKFILIIICILFTFGCGNKVAEDAPSKGDINVSIDNNTSDTYKEVNEEENENNEVVKPNNSTNETTLNSGNNSVSNNKDKVEEKEEITYSNEDILVINELENIDDNVDSLLNQGEKESVKDKLKGVFITLVDFAFYDGEIKGVTFKELTEMGKEKVLKIINTIDEKIEAHFPGYKETISAKASTFFAKASEMIKKGANNIKDFAKEKLGEKYYQDMVDAKDELVYYTKNALSIVGNVGSSLFNSAKDKLSNWYQDFKNNS